MCGKCHIWSWIRNDLKDAKLSFQTRFTSLTTTQNHNNYMDHNKYIDVNFDQIIIENNTQLITIQVFHSRKASLKTWSTEIIPN